MRVFTFSTLIAIMSIAALGCRQTSEQEREAPPKTVEPGMEQQPGMEPKEGMEPQPGTEPKGGMKQPQGAAEQPGMDRPAGKDIVAVAQEAGNFNTLLSALTAADLKETLSGPGPYTVFAPTDEAFAKLPKEQLDALLADKEKLRAVLTYHVIPGKVLASDITAGKMTSMKTVNGQPLSIDTKDGVKIGNAKVVKSDIQASNGVIHVIDTVLMPGGEGSAPQARAPKQPSGY